MAKMYIYEAFYGNTEVWLWTSRYKDNDSLYIGLMCNENGWDEPFADLTVNLPTAMKTNNNCVFLDTNNLPNAEAFVRKIGIGKPTGKYGHSGYCSYPEYEIDTELLKEITR